MDHNLNDLYEKCVHIVDLPEARVQNWQPYIRANRTYYVPVTVASVIFSRFFFISHYINYNFINFY